MIRKKKQVSFSSAETLAQLSADELAKNLKAGEALYQQYQCVSCHRDDGNGLKTLEKLGSKYNLETLAAYFRRPVAPMPVFPMSDSERAELSTYMIDRYPL